MCGERGLVRRASTNEEETVGKIDSCNGTGRIHGLQFWDVIDTHTTSRGFSVLYQESIAILPLHFFASCVCVIVSWIPDCLRLDYSDDPWHWKNSQRCITTGRGFPGARDC